MILAYHHVAPGRPPTPGRDDGWAQLILPEQLAQHVRALRDRGHRFISLEEMVQEIRRLGRAPRRAVTITIDDGWRDAYDHAFPVLRSLSVDATFFVTTSHLRDGVETSDPRKVTAAQIREIAAGGMTVGAHTRCHGDLRMLSKYEQTQEIAGSKADVENVLQAPIKFFAYPGGLYDRSIVDTVKEAGFSAACAVSAWGPGTRQSLFWISRDTFSVGMNTFRDRLMFSPTVRRAMSSIRTRQTMQ